MISKNYLRQKGKKISGILKHFYRHNHVWSLFNTIVIFISLLFFTSCSDNKAQKNVSPDTDFIEQNIQPIDASNLELAPQEYIQWLRSNKGLTFNIFENDTIMQSIIYQPIQLQAAMGMQSSGMTYEQLLNSKKGFHYFFVECLYKKISAVKNNNRNDYLNYVKEHIYIIKNNTDTLKNIAVESFTSSVLNEPDNIMILVPEDDIKGDLICSINNAALGLREVKIKIPEKQFGLFPKLKI